MKSPSKDSLTFEFCNARSICNKFHLVKDYLQNKSDLNMLFLTETWLHSKHTDSMFCPPNFNVMRFDRMHGRGGGVLLLYRQGLQLQRIDVNFSRNHCYEVICVDLYLCNSSIRFCCVYLPPCQTSRKK